MLTIGRYAHARLHDLTGALDAARPDAPGGEESKTATVLATGTDGKGLTVDVVRGQMRGQLGGETCQNVARRGEWNADCSVPVTGESDGPQVLTLADFGDKKATWRNVA